MREYRFEYTDGNWDTRWFNTYEEARDFAKMEGDHLVEWGGVDEFREDEE